MLILDLIVISLVVAIEPIPLTVLILVLSGPNGTRRGMWFLLGWVSCVLGVILLGLAIGHGTHSGTTHEAAGWVNWLKLVAGVALVYYAFRERRPTRPAAKQPAWIRGVDRLNGPILSALAAFLSPQVVVFAGTLVILQMHLSALSQSLLAALYLFVACSPDVALVGIAVFRPEQSTAQLEKFRAFLDANRQQVLFVLFLMIGLYLSVRSILALS